MSIGIIGVGITSMLILSLVYRLTQKSNSTHAVQRSTINPTTISESGKINTGEGSYAYPTSDANVYRFVSPRLRITFAYTSATYYQGQIYQKFAVKEVGNVIYTYEPKVQPYQEGKSIEVFQKDSKEDLAAAIKKRFLTNISEMDCFIDTKDTFYNSKDYPYSSNFTLASISFPGNIGGDEPQIQAKKCPTGYTNTDGNGYFLMDKNHPDRFLYVMIGQTPPLFQENTLSLF